MSARKQTAQKATVLSQRNQDGVTIYMPNLELFNRFFNKTSAGTYSSSSHAALAYDLLECKRSLDKGQDLASLRNLDLHHKLSWLQSQPLFLPLLEGSFEDLCKTLCNDPSILETAFSRTRGPHGALKVKMEIVQSSSSESSYASEEKDPSPAAEKAEAEKARVSPQTDFSGSPDEGDLQPLAPDSRSPPLSSGSKVVRTNWANFPLNSTSQSVLLTKFQVSSGAVSVPVGRAHAVLGAFSKSCTVTLQSSSASSSTSHQSSFQCGYKLYQSQPTQVFLTQLKAFFSATAAKGGDVLCLSEISPGLCKAEIWHAASPQAVEFKSLLANGWTDVSPPVKKLISPALDGTPKTSATAKKQQKRTSGREEAAAEKEGQGEGKEPPSVDLTANTAATRRMRHAPRRFISYSSSGTDEEGEEEYFEVEKAAKTATTGTKRKPGRPPVKEEEKEEKRGRPRKQQQEQQEQQQPAILPATAQNGNATTGKTSTLFSPRPRQQRQVPITDYTMTQNAMQASPPSPPRPLPPASLPSPAPAAKHDLRRSPAKKPRSKDSQPPQTATTLFDSPTAQGPIPLIVSTAAPAPAAAPGLSGRKQQQQQQQQEEKKQQRTSKSRTPRVAKTKRHCSSFKPAKAPRSGGVSRGKKVLTSSDDEDDADNNKGTGGSSSGGRSGRKPGGRYTFRSDVAYIKIRRKGIPKRAHEGEPNMQAYYNALSHVDRLYKAGCLAI